MKKLKQIRFSGLGGQGIVMMGTVLGKAAIAEGMWVSGSNAYGSQARGGDASSEVVISDQPIKYPHVISSDVLITLSQGTYDKYKKNMVSEGGLIFYDRSMVKSSEMENINQVGFDVLTESLARLDNKQSANMVMLSAVNSIAQIVQFESLVQIIEETVSTKYLELNLKAMELGKEMGEKIV